MTSELSRHIIIINRDNAKLRIFSFIPQRQCMQPNFMNYTYQTSKHTNTTRTTKTTTSLFVSPLTQSLCSYKGGNANSGVFIFKLCNKLANFLEHIYMRPQVRSYRSEISNRFEKSFRLHGDFTAAACKW